MKSIAEALISSGRFSQFDRLDEFRECSTRESANKLLDRLYEFCDQNDVLLV
jgi:hypothetical protein